VQLDLNLLTALDALLEEGSVMGAADRLHLSSPAVSRTLGRLRRLTGDDILVRTGRTMTPTPYALAIREQVHDLVLQAQAVLAPSRELDLDALERTFTLQCHDAVATAIGPALLASIRAKAPRVRLRLLAEAAVDTDDLRHGRVDLEIGADAPELPEIRSETIGSDRFVLVMHPDHPSAAGELDLAGYAGQTHILVSRRGRLSDPVDAILAAHGLHRTVAAAVATSATALYAVSLAPHLLTVPERVCRPLIDALGLAVRTLPVPLEPLPIRQNWHQRYDSDAAHAWLRQEVRDAVATIAPEETAGSH
jgi:DNA-binding transcriptional LysR family regulator